MNDIANTSVGAAIFATATVAFTWVALTRWLRVGATLRQWRREEHAFTAEGVIHSGCAHPVLRDARDFAWERKTLTELQIERNLFRAVDPEIRRGELHRQIAISGSFALTLAGFLLTCTGDADPAQLTRHVAPYFAFSLTGILIAAVGSAVDAQLLAAREGCRLIGLGLLEYHARLLP